MAAKGEGEVTVARTGHLTWFPVRHAVILSLWILASPAVSQSRGLDPELRQRIDAFVESERQASGIPGIALAVVHESGLNHVRGFGHDGRGTPVGTDTPFPIGSLTKSFTALLVRQAIDAGRLEADAPVQRYLPWFRVADPQASTRITLRHLLNQTSGFSRADGIEPLLQGSTANIEQLTRRLGNVSLNRAVGERFEYSNLNFVILGAVLQAVTGERWQDLIHAHVFRPLAMTHSHTDHDAARQAGMTALHRMWFGVPVQQQATLPPGFASTGSLVSSASDMARYLQALLSGGVAPSGHLLSSDGTAQLLAPASAPARSTLLSADFAFRYGEGWFVGPFGAAADARWHLGNLASFAAWMVLLPDTRQAIVVLINANTELPVNEVNAVMSRIPIGVVNLLRDQPVPQGPSLRRAYLPFNVASAVGVAAVVLMSWWASRARRHGWAMALLLLAVVLALALRGAGLSLEILGAFAPDLAMVLTTVLALLCLPAVWRVARRLWGFVADRREPGLG